MKRNLFIFHRGTITDEKPPILTVFHSPTLTPFCFHWSLFFDAGQINFSINDTVHLNARPRTLLLLFARLDRNYEQREAFCVLFVWNDSTEWSEKASECNAQNATGWWTPRVHAGITYLAKPKIVGGFFPVHEMERTGYRQYIIYKSIRWLPANVHIVML